MPGLSLDEIEDLLEEENDELSEEELRDRERRERDKTRKLKKFKEQDMGVSGFDQ